MQTFLPYPDFAESARVLDYRRLGKQRVEALQIYNILTGRTEKLGWRNHPAVLMWNGYEHALGFYMNAMIDEWISRGYKNTIKKAAVNLAWNPPWINSPEFHASHRSNLLRKDPIYYGQFGWKETPDLPYVWPVSNVAVAQR